MNRLKVTRVTGLACPFIRVWAAITASDKCHKHQRKLGQLQAKEIISLRQSRGEESGGLWGSAVEQTHAGQLIYICIYIYFAK